MISSSLESDHYTLSCSLGLGSKTPKKNRVLTEMFCGCWPLFLLVLIENLGKFESVAQIMTFLLNVLLGCKGTGQHHEVAIIGCSLQCKSQLSGPTVGSNFLGSSGLGPTTTGWGEGAVDTEKVNHI